MLEHVLVAGFQVNAVDGAAAVPRLVAEKKAGFTVAELVDPPMVRDSSTVPVFQADESSGLLAPEAHAVLSAVCTGDLTR
jgi:hypothetical protein